MGGSMKISLKQYPIDKKGNLVSYADTRWYKPDSWVDNESFEAELEYCDYTRGRSSIKFVFKNVKRKSQKWEMFLSDFDEIVKKLKDGKIKGWWKVRKSGANYGLVYLGETEKE